MLYQFLQPMQSSGYTPLSAFRKPIMNQSTAIEDKINSKTPIVATTDQEGISGELLASLSHGHVLTCPSTFIGYVTHKQLSDFGHRMQ